MIIKAAHVWVDFSQIFIEVNEFKLQKSGYNTSNVKTVRSAVSALYTAVALDMSTCAYTLMRILSFS